MNVGNSVRMAIKNWEQGELESAMLHACNAVDGTAKNHYPKKGSNYRFTKFLRENYRIFGPMALPGIDMATKWSVKLEHPNAGGDTADLIYGIHRCTHGHGAELPNGFELVPDAAGPHRLTRLFFGEGKVRLSDRTIFGLLAVAICSPTNRGQSVPDGYYLTFAGQKFPINNWWGRAEDFASIVAREPIPIVTLDFKG